MNLHQRLLGHYVSGYSHVLIEDWLPGTVC